MQATGWENQPTKRITPFRLKVRFTLLVTLSLQIIFLSGNIFHGSYALAVDEKPIVHEKTPPSPTGILKTNFNCDDFEVISGYAEDIFDLAKIGKWKRVSKKLAHLEKTEQNLSDKANIIGADKIAALSKAILELDKAVTAKNRQGTMLAANKITAIAALITKSLKQRVPTNVALLDYYARELEIWSEANNTSKLSEIVTKMHLTWQVLMPSVISTGESKDVKKFGDIMKHLEAAKTPEEYGRLINSVHDEVDNLEKVFLKKPTRSE